MGASSDVVFIPIADLVPPLQPGVAWRERDGTPVLMRFVELLIAKEALDRAVI